MVGPLELSVECKRFYHFEKMIPKPFLSSFYDEPDVPFLGSFHNSELLGGREIFIKCVSIFLTLNRSIFTWNWSFIWRVSRLVHRSLVPDLGCVWVLMFLALGLFLKQHKWTDLQSAGLPEPSRHTRLITGSISYTGLLTGSIGSWLCIKQIQDTHLSITECLTSLPNNTIDRKGYFWRPLKTMKGVSDFFHFRGITTRP